MVDSGLIRIFLSSADGRQASFAYVHAHSFYGAPTGFAGMLAHSKLPARRDVALGLVSSAGEALPADLGERFKAHFGVTPAAYAGRQPVP